MFLYNLSLEFSPGSSCQESNRVGTDYKRVDVLIIRGTSGSSELDDQDSY